MEEETKLSLSVSEGRFLIIVLSLFLVRFGEVFGLGWVSSFNVSVGANSPRQKEAAITTESGIPYRPL